eukprot:1102102_1
MGTYESESNQRTATIRRRLVNNDDATNALTIYDLDILNQNKRPMVLTTRIECDEGHKQIIIARSRRATSFEADVQALLRTYFANNTDLRFKVFTPQDELDNAWSSKREDTEDEDSTAFQLSILVLSI